MWGLEKCERNRGQALPIIACLGPGQRDVLMSQVRLITLEKCRLDLRERGLGSNGG